MLTIFTFAVFAFMAISVIQLVSIHLFFNRMRDAHPSAYEAIGSPRWRIQFGDTALREGIQYIHAKKFVALNDPELDAIYRRLRQQKLVSYLLAAIAMGALIADLFRIGF
jgi:hypothetical protein